MERKEEEKREEPWTGRSILGVAAAGAAAVAAGAFFLLSSIGDRRDQDQKEDDDPPAQHRQRTMKAPGSGGQNISRERFEEDPKNYYSTQRQKGPKAAVARFQ